MNRTPITSKTGLCGVAYNATTKTLELAFASKKAGEKERVYPYTPFTAADWEAFQKAESKGSHFLKQIKPAFRCTRIEEPDAEDEKKDRKTFETSEPEEPTPF
jgi:hypothetical protein